jgi:hypothetical protein
MSISEEGVNQVRELEDLFFQASGTQGKIMRRFREADTFAREGRITGIYLRAIKRTARRKAKLRAAIRSTYCATAKN